MDFDNTGRWEEASATGTGLGGTVFGSSTRTPVLAICGGGNGGHAVAVVASQNFDGEIRWLVRGEEHAAQLRDGMSTGGLESTGVITATTAGRVRTVSAEPYEVIPAADIVMIVAPAFAHAPILTQIGPYLDETVSIGCLPTRGGFEFDAARLVPGLEPSGRRRLFGLQTLPWSTRIVRSGQVVNFGAVKAKVLLATLPPSEVADVSLRLTRILGTEMVPTTSFLSMTLGNPGQFIHPGLMYGLFRDWDGEEYDGDAIPRFYRDTTEEQGELVAQLSAEATSVARELERESNGALDLSGVLPVHEWLRVSYPTQTVDTSTVAACFRTGPLQHREAPMEKTDTGRFVPNFGYRYLTEDVPYGLVVTKAIALLAGVGTPLMDDVIEWTQRHTGASYLVDGKLDEAGTAHLPIPQGLGIESSSELLDWYRRLEARASDG
jgi:NAD/NADP octopine/nopaline dehydrogenase-like protein